MLRIKCLASGSTGNSYAIDDGESVLLLEAGIPAKLIKRGYIDVLSRVAGCLVTHEHKDHAVSLSDVAGMGIDVYASQGTFDAVGRIAATHRANPVHNGQQFQVGTWTVKAFETEHDAAEPLGFLLYSQKAHEKVLFATDTYYIKYRFKGLTTLMVECNYSLPVLLQNARNGNMPEALKNRLLKSHMSVQNLCKYLLRTDLSTVSSIYLLHRSSGNGSDSFVDTIQALTGIPTKAF